MTHSEYTELTVRLLLHSRGSDRSRELLSDPGGVTVWRSVIKADNDLSRWMDERANGWTASNQERADKGLKPTADFRALFDAMVGFMSSTETPGKMGVLYEKTRTRCQAWIDQADTWFPGLNNPPFIRKLLASRAYKDQVRDGIITPPFTWNGSIVSLAKWLAPELLHSLNLVDEGGRHDWMLVDRVFNINGKPVTARQLSEAYRKG